MQLRAQPWPDRRLVGMAADPGVERAPEEVTRAAAVWGSARVLCGDDGTAPRVRAVAEEVNVLHLAGHGRHSGDSPWFSAVELADGPWFGYDIDHLAHTPSVVVLSACELGRATVRYGEEAVGMSAAWLHAGARAVLSSPTLVADDAACESLARWHHRLVRDGEAPGDALATVVGEVGDREGAVVPFLCFGAGW